MPYHNNINHNNPITKQPSRSVVEQIDLQKQKLEREIYQLEKQIKKQGKKKPSVAFESYKSSQVTQITNNNNSHRNAHNINGGNKSSTGITTKGHTKHQKQSPFKGNTNKVSSSYTPAISQTWKQLFSKTEPYIYGEEGINGNMDNVRANDFGMMSATNNNRNDMLNVFDKVLPKPLKRPSMPNISSSLYQQSDSRNLTNQNRQEKRPNEQVINLALFPSEPLELTMQQLLREFQENQF